MGCDIHVYIERRTPAGWEWCYPGMLYDLHHLDKPMIPEWAGRPKEELLAALDAYRRLHDSYEDEGFGYSRHAPTNDWWFEYHSRNYRLFFVLAGVRERDEELMWMKIASPRGVPKDMSPGVLDQYTRWDSDGHSHSYFTFAELAAVDLAKSRTRTAVIPLGVFVEWFLEGRQGFPWGFGGSPDGRSREVTLDQAKEAATAWRERHPKDHLVMATYAREFNDQHLVMRVIDQVGDHGVAGWFKKILDLAPVLEAPLEDLRVTFWFDN